MNTIVLDKIPFNIDKESAFKKLNMTIEDDEAAEIGQLVEQVNKIGLPKAVFGEACIDLRGEDFVATGGVIFKSRILRANLNDSNKVYPYIVTSGTELDDWSNSIGDMLQQYWAGAIKELVLGIAVKFTLDNVRKRLNTEKISAMNPGSHEDWPISEQRQLFSLLGDTEKTIGVRLTESNIMLPVKTVSGLLYVSEKL